MQKHLANPLLLALSTFLLFNLSAHGQEIKEGTDYRDLGGEAIILPDGPVEVTEFFWFGCPSCFRFEPFLLAWQKPSTIYFQNVPATLSRSWEFHAHVYYAFELLGLKNQLMQKFYDEIHVNRSRVRNAEQLQKWAEQQPGVDAEKLARTINSFGVITKVSQASLLANKYGITGVPTLVVGGRYVTSPAMAQSEIRALQIVEYLVKNILSEQ